MVDFEDGWKALSIRQPWVDMILSGQKTIEIREWKYAPTLRGRFLIHCAHALDWKTIPMFGGRERYDYPRGMFVAVAELDDVIEIDPARNWANLANQHRVIHPSNFGQTVLGFRLRSVAPLRKALRGRGGAYFFSPMRDVAAKIEDELGRP